jgi:predicted nucleic acid-binding protein
MLVVSDSSPLIDLSVIGRLGILPNLFNRVVVPASVYSEITNSGKQGAAQLLKVSWLEVHQCSNRSKVKTIANHSSALHLGEVEAIVLAEELKADFLAMDERQGRNLAFSRDLPVVGVLGILIMAKDANLLTSIKPEIEQLKIKGFRLGKTAVQSALREAKEV